MGEQRPGHACVLRRERHRGDVGRDGLGLSTDDRAVLQAMLDVESAWVRVQRRLGLVDDDVVAVVACGALPVGSAPTAWIATGEMTKSKATIMDVRKRATAPSSHAH